MGEMADWLIEQGMDALAEHESGNCEYGCPYCDPPPKPKKKAVRKKPKK